MGEHYQNHSIEIQDDADASAVILGSLGSCSAPIDNNWDQSSTSGTAYSEDVSLVGQSIKLSGDTFDLPKAFTHIGLTGRRLAEAVGPPAKVGLALYQARYLDSQLQAGSVHRRLRYALSYLRMGRISVSHQQSASVDFEAMAIYDGTNKPIIPETGVALPTLPGNPGRWTLGKVVISDGTESVTINCKTQLDIDFGVSAPTFGCESEPWDQGLNVSAIQPSINMTTFEIDKFQDVANQLQLAGLLNTNANSAYYLRKRLPGRAGFVPDATAEHIRLDISGSSAITNAHSGGPNQPATMGLQTVCASDGVNAPIVLTPNVPIV
ncbi:MAG: hypothetical protein AAF394_05570 [Planctomycetota bacterium]